MKTKKKSFPLLGSWTAFDREVSDRDQEKSRLAHIIWKDTEKYKNLVILIGGFHQLRVRRGLSIQRL